MSVVALLVALAACQPDEPTTDDTDLADTDPIEAGDPEVLVGAFQITLIPPDDTVDPPRAGATTVVGKVYDGPTPQSVVWEDEQVDGDCRLIKPRIPFCETSCGEEACVEDDTCQPWPTAQTVGTVTLSGLQATDGSTRFSMDPLGTTYQKPAQIDLTWPPLGAGDPVELTTGASSFVPPFTITGAGIAPLVLQTSDWTLDGAAPFVLAWQAATTASLIDVKVDISHHGGTRGQILCETADDGELTLSADMVRGLLDLGVSGFPSMVVSRTATGSHTISAGRVDLVTSSTVERFVDIPGLNSCFSDEECPEDQTCQDDLTCQ